ncbi:MAG: glutamate mutase L, partial [Candidatus Marinimicrobia bacterium]|nr:glutamate mutase L [Candidatus Neomarinimicrobiota bacterium]
FDIDQKELTNRIGNKMIRPTTVPQSLEELFIEQAIAREALRLSFKQHKEFATSLKGVQKERTISDAFDQSSSGESLVNMMELDLLVGSGGVLSHAPRREQSARMLIDSFMPEGITQLAVDSIFMMPQLGVLANIEKEELAADARAAALEVFHKDCLIHLGTCIAPIGNAKNGAIVLTVEFTYSDGKKVHHELKKDELFRFEAPYEPVSAVLKPDKKMDIGSGKGEPIETTVHGGVVGLILDGRSRPISIPTSSDDRLAALKNWSEAVNEYPNQNHN